MLVVIWAIHGRAIDDGMTGDGNMTWPRRLEGKMMADTW